MLDELRKKKILNRLNQVGVSEGFESKKKYSEISGISMDELDREEAEGANGHDLVMEPKSKITRESAGDQVGKIVPRAPSLDRVRKPMYDALSEEEEARRKSALGMLYKGEKK